MFAFETSPFPTALFYSIVRKKSSKTSERDLFELVVLLLSGDVGFLSTSDTGFKNIFCVDYIWLDPTQIVSL